MSLLRILFYDVAFFRLWIATTGLIMFMVYNSVEHGAELNVKTINNETPLHFAARKGKNDCVQILLNSGAKVKLVYLKLCFVYLAIKRFK